MNKFLPNKYVKNIFSINYESLKKSGIKCLIFDLDNTIAPVNIHIPDAKTKELLRNLTDAGFKIIIMTNSPEKRFKPFKKHFEYDVETFSTKPLKRKYKKLLKKHSFKNTEYCCIGDQMVTDVYGGNRAGMMTILTTPISNVEYKVTGINRFFERIIIKKLTKKGLFKVGEFYE